MKEPIWIGKALALAIHDEMLQTHGGQAGIPNESFLDSALAKPQRLFQQKPEPTLFELAAAYGSGIVGIHPFEDGNKRTGFMLAYTFLEANGIHFVGGEADVVVTVQALKSDGITEAEFAAWLKENSK